MLFLKTNVKVLTTRSTRSIIRRSFTSSLLRQKEQNNSASTSQTHLNNTVDDEEKLQCQNDVQEPFVSSGVINLSFMPVTHIPQTEFAHNSFFSLHRPLLGLEDNKMDKPFFSNQLPEDDHIDINEQISNYMMTLRPFEVPAPPGIMDQVKEQDHNALFNTSESMHHSQQDEEEDYYMDHSLPMYYMPESDDIVEYLTTMQDRLVRQNALYDSIFSNDTASINTGSMGRTKRRFTTMGQEKNGIKASSSLSPTIRSKQQKQGLYKHRWNK